VCVVTLANCCFSGAIGPRYYQDAVLAAEVDDLRHYNNKLSLSSSPSSSSSSRATQLSSMSNGYHENVLEWRRVNNEVSPFFVLPPSCAPTSTSSFVRPRRRTGWGLGMQMIADNRWLTFA
jgi:hypothetical protein